MKKVLGSLETGKSLDGLKLKINQIKRDLSQLEESNKPMPELINSTNLLRSNEILTKTNEKKTELLNAYESYFKDLESVLKKIQTGLSILKTTPKKKTRKKRTRKKKKTKRKTMRRKKTRTRKKSRKRKSSKRKR
uniref:Uncharacterized protein n=1 Tax=uncultured archaeon W4-93a TaxID=1131007 RepID=H9BWZ3_9ARCH|nr:hypothetical protein [uncultured archaeon W4-93a]